MEHSLGIGFISFAHGHTHAYAAVMQSYKDVRLLGAWDPDKNRAQTICDPMGIHVYTTMEELLANPEIDAVIIGSETCCHEEHAVAAAEAG
ncbi:MAG: Gfo/Idh/MocA family oxidoreductase, partial [Candidatus Hydrogenedentes bacterium]|nr:Gfo/Idh/MocA family oxidoreductase [Candidatus Hydrogenedentota bacterium]